MRRQLLVVAAVGLATAGVLMGPAEADARTVWPTCAGVHVAAGLRVFVDPGSVVAGRVVEVRSGRTQLVRRRDGVWVGTVPARPDGGREVHVVVKSGGGRWSSWTRCRTVKP